MMPPSSSSKASKGNGAITSVPSGSARPVRIRHAVAGSRRRERVVHDVPVLLRQHHGGLPVRAPAGVRPRRVPRPALLHRPRADAASPVGLLPRPRHRLRLPRPHPARPGHVRLPRHRPLPGRARQRVRRRAVARAVPLPRPGQRVPPARLPRQLAALPGLPRPPPAMPERVRDGLRRLLRLPRLGRLLRRAAEAVGSGVRDGRAARVLRGVVGRHPGGERQPAAVRGVQQRLQPRAGARGGGGRRVGVRHQGGVGAAGGEPGVLRRVPRHGRGMRALRGEPRRPVPLRGLELHLQLRLLVGLCEIKRGGAWRRRRISVLGRSCLRIVVSLVVRINSKYVKGVNL